MDSRSLLLLGMLIAHSRHGYQINEIIEHNLGYLIDIKKSTAYTILDRLSEAGLVSMTTEQEGNRPPRKVYSITPSGERQFYELLKENLETPDLQYFEEDIGIMFIDHLSKEDARASLLQKLQKLDQQIENYKQVPHHEVGVGVNIAVNHHLHLLRAEREWLEQVIKDLSHHIPM